MAKDGTFCSSNKITTSQRTITTQGTATIKADPDHAMVSFGVVTSDKHSSVALQQNSETMTKLFSLLEEEEIPKEDYYTSGFNLQPQYDYKKSIGNLSGFIVSNNIVVKISIDKLGKTLDKLVIGGANTVSSINFGNTNRQELLDKARTQATQNAKQNAELLLKGLDEKVGAVRNVSEIVPSNYGGSSRNMMYGSASMEACDGEVPINAGKSEFTVNVSATFDIK